MPEPTWLPDCRDVSAYPSADAPLARWAWEFLRRNPEYQKAYSEFIAPRLSSDGFDLDVGADGIDPIQIMRVRFGIAFLPPDPADATTLPVFEHGLIKQYYPGPSGKSLPPTQFAVIFDLESPVEPQVARAREYLKQRRDWLRSRGELPAIEKQQRNHVERWREYLRLLDGKAAGLGTAELAKILFPEIENLDPDYAGSKLVRNGLKAAQKLRDMDWRWIVTHPAN